MSIKKLKPITSGQRFRVVNNYDDISKKKNLSNVKYLSIGKNKSGGRNNYGKITMRYIGGGHKKKYRIIDFKRNKFNIPAIVKTIEYDPNRSSFISLLFYADGEKRYIISPNGIKIGQKIFSGKNISPDIGNALYLNDIPLGTIISCIEIKPGKGATLARSAGSYAQLMAKDGKYVIVKLPSGKNQMILNNCIATIGSVSNVDHQLEILGKAGRNRWLGRRPRTRGVAMNPIDHPMGGGEGKSSGGHPRNRKGIPSKGFKTRSKKTSSKYIIDNKK
ncbi:MAG: 50S ribosomal protein L2 [Candidatus Bostrichicola ureolyticus]|nr:MAG: 50S ribosomal protein L2 [Candidatus Bostrichicola ureolyticus]